MITYLTGVIIAFIISIFTFKKIITSKGDIFFLFLLSLFSWITIGALFAFLLDSFIIKSSK